MKKLLIILGSSTLIGTSTTSLFACDKPQKKEYTHEKLKELKEENKINTANQEIRDNLEWMTQQEKPFNQVDNKYYFVIWHGLFDNEWEINMFNNNATQIRIDTTGYLIMKNFGDLQVGYGRSWKDWTNYPNYFKAVYHWNDNNFPNIPIINSITGKITDWNLKQQNNINNKIKITVKNKDILENLIYQLETNYFNWSSITD